VFPDLPKLSDVYPGLEVTPWLALFAPAGVPESVLARLRAEINKLLADPDTVERISRLGGLQPYVTTPAEFDQLLRTEYAKYAEVVKAAGAKID
jgi:tripartite-type tricarboxylate transporter receptor subunit TctC